ncbi:MAG: hypothetical protein ABSH20_02605 [Tepidisphaeraceae bacterium]|jgi:hypothetical protein
MSPDRIKAILDQQPFQPFTLHTGDGKTVDVLSREFALLYPGGRTLLIVEPKFRGAEEEADFTDHIIDVFLITKVTAPAERRGGNRRRKAS